MDYLLVLKALSLVLIIEGLPLVLAPSKAQQTASAIAQTPVRLLRRLGLVLMLIGAGFLMVLT